MTKLSDLNEAQKQHLAWRLDRYTGCGYGTAQRVAQGKLGDLDLVDIFITFGAVTKRGAKNHTLKVMAFELQEPVYIKILAMVKKHHYKWQRNLLSLNIGCKSELPNLYKLHKEAIAEYERQMVEYQR